MMVPMGGGGGGGSTMQHPRQMSFDAGSTLYIGQAGSIYRGAFEASPKKLTKLIRIYFILFFSPGRFAGTEAEQLGLG